MGRFVLILLITTCAIGLSSAQSVVLLTPTDNSTDLSGYPTFTWQFTGGTITGLTYTFKIAEYDSSIGDAASLSTNLIYSEVISDNSTSMSYDYPVTLDPLDTCKHYVWQVTASYTTYTTEEPIVPLETYNFSSDYFHLTTSCTTRSGERSGSPSSTIYIIPQNQIDQYVYLITTDSLYFKYNEPYTNTTLPYRIYSSEGNVITSSSLTVNYGLNYLGIDITSESILESPKIYTFEIKTPKGELLRAKFEKKTL